MKILLGKIKITQKVANTIQLFYSVVFGCTYSYNRKVWQKEIFMRKFLSKFWTVSNYEEQNIFFQFSDLSNGYVSFVSLFNTQEN